MGVQEHDAHVLPEIAKDRAGLACIRQERHQVAVLPRGRNQCPLVHQARDAGVAGRVAPVMIACHEEPEAVVSPSVAGIEYADLAPEPRRVIGEVRIRAVAHAIGIDVVAEIDDGDRRVATKRAGPAVHVLLQRGEQGRVSRDRIAGIADRDRSTSANLLPSVNPTFNWVRLAQRIPVRVKLDPLPAGVHLVAGQTVSVSVVAEGSGS